MIYSYSQIEAIRRIESFDGQYDPDHGLDGCLSVWDQLMICETLAAAKPVYQEEYSNTKYSTNGNVLMVAAKSELNQSKPHPLEELRACDYRTPPVKVASLLGEYFHDPNTKQDHWLYIAKTWPPRQILYVIDEMTQAIFDGRLSLKIPAAYFTRLIKYHKKRKSLRTPMVAANTHETIQ